MTAPRPTIEQIKRAVAEDCGVPLRLIVSERTDQESAAPRHLAMSLACELSTLSLPAIGRLFRRDHSTVIYACRQVAARRRKDPAVDERFRRIKAKLLGLGSPAAEPRQLELLPPGPLFDFALEAA